MNAAARWVCRFQILLVRHLRSVSFWVTAALVLLLQYYISSVSLPTAMNRSVGLYQGGSALAGEIVNQLLESESSYTWKVYDSRDSLADAVRTGEVDCGFAFDERIDNAAEAVNAEDLYEGGASAIVVPDLNGCVDYYYSSSSTKGASAKESVYAQVLSAVSPVILDSAVRSGTIFKDNGPEVREMVQAELKKVLSGDSLLKVHFEVYGGSEEGGDGKKAEKPAETVQGMRPQGLAGILLFLAALLFATAKYRADSSCVCAWFRRGRLLFRILEIYAPLLTVGLGTAILLLVQRQAGLLHLLLLVPVLLLTSLWCALFVRLFPHEGVYLFLSTGLIVISAVLVSSAGSLFILSSVRWLKFLLPAYWIQAALML